MARAHRAGERLRVVGETPWIVRGLAEGAGSAAPVLLLSGGLREPLDPATLRIGADGVLRCTVSRGHARFGRAAQIALGMKLEEDPPGSGSFVLDAAGRRWAISHPVEREGGDP
jgi:hypothetical protein